MAGRLILEILYDHLSSYGRIAYETNPQGKTVPKPAKDRDSRLDVELVAETIMLYADKAGFYEEDVKDIGFYELDFRGLSFKYLLCEVPGFRWRSVLASDADFSAAWVDNVDFHVCDFTYSGFYEAHLNEAEFTACNLTSTQFNNSELSFGKFSDCTLKHTRFLNAIMDQVRFYSNEPLEYIKFVGAKLRGGYLTDIEFVNCIFTSADLTLADFTASHLTHGIIQREQVNTIIYDENAPPRNLPDELIAPEDRAYIVGEDGKRRFVKSDKPWSEQLIDG